MHTCEECQPPKTDSAIPTPASEGEESYTKTTVELRFPIVWGRPETMDVSTAVQNESLAPKHACRLICPTCDDFFMKLRALGLRPTWLRSNVPAAGIFKFTSVILANVQLWYENKPDGFRLDPAEFGGEGGALPAFLDGPVQRVRMPLLRQNRVSAHLLYDGAIPEGFTEGHSFNLVLVFEER